MSVKFPKDQQELVNSTKTDFQRHNQTSNPFLKNSFLGAILTAFSLRVWDFYLQLKAFEREFFLPTANRFLSIFGAWWSVTQNQATQSTGNVVATGTVASVINANSQLQSSIGVKFQTTVLATIVNTSVSITSLTRSGSTVTATTSVDHNMSSQLDVSVTGAAESDYNGTHSINVIAADQFTYQITGTPTTPATGTITGSADFVNIPAESIDFGVNANVINGEALTFTTPITGVDNDARADFNGLSGGADAESKNDYRDRILERVQNPIAHFNESDIIAKAKEVSGVTRVFVKKATPAAGQVTVYFVRDNDASIIPDSGELSTTKDKLLEILPATVNDSDLIVSAPTAVTANFTFTAVSVDTTTMRTAIETSLASVVKKQTEGVDFKEDDYRAAIVGTVDRETNTALTSFTLTTTGDFTVASGSIAVLGTITFP